jgi:hypothetical protein
MRLKYWWTLTSRPFFREKINRNVPKRCFYYNRHGTFSLLIQADRIVSLWKTNAYGSFQEVTRASTPHNLQYGFQKCTNFRENSYTIRGLPQTFYHVTHTHTIQTPGTKQSLSGTNTVTLIKPCHGACSSALTFPLSLSLSLSLSASSDVTFDLHAAIPTLALSQHSNVQIPCIFVHVWI